MTILTAGYCMVRPCSNIIPGENVKWIGELLFRYPHQNSSKERTAINRILTSALLCWLALLPALIMGCGEMTKEEKRALQAEDLVNKGKADFNKKDYVQAKQDFEQALALDQSNTKAANALAWLDQLVQEKGLVAKSDPGPLDGDSATVQSGETERSGPLIDGTLITETEPLEFWRAYIKGAEAYHNGDYAALLDASEEALDWLSPDSPLYYKASKAELAALILNRYYDDASDAVTGLINARPDDPGLYSLATISYQGAGRIDDAVIAAESAYNLDNGNPVYQNNLAYSYAVSGGNLSEAYDLASAALQKQPQSPAYLDTMAWVLYQSGDVAGAYDYINQALDHVPGPMEDGEMEEHYQIILNEFMNGGM